MTRSRLTRFPDEFEALLSPRGRQLLLGRDEVAAGALSRAPFFSDVGLLDEAVLGDCTQILAGAFADLLLDIGQPLPPPNQGLLPYTERLPKVGRMQSIPMGHAAGSREEERAEGCGLVAMVKSESYRAFVAALAGGPVDGPQNLQVLCMRPGDYAGPHTDHHPEEERMSAGYYDVHFTFCTEGVRDQFIVYARDGHFTEQRPIAQAGTVTAYRLPLWHYTTPLQASAPQARRWLVLGTFFDPLPAQGAP